MTSTTLNKSEARYRASVASAAQKIADEMDASVMNGLAQRAIGTPFAILYVTPAEPVKVLTPEEKAIEKKRAMYRKKWQQQKAKREDEKVKRTYTEMILRDNAHLKGWTI
jgi:hypothetical protein